MNIIMMILCELISHLLEQLKPLPTVNGGRHEQVKFSLRNPSLSQSALGSQGSDRHGSGTEVGKVLTAITNMKVWCIT